MQEIAGEVSKKLNLNSPKSFGTTGKAYLGGAGIVFPKVDPSWDQVAANTATRELPYRTHYSASAATSTSYSPADVLRKAGQADLPR
jgi:hypothetical protein